MNYLEPWMMNLEAWLAWFIYWNFAAFFVHRAKSSEGIVSRLLHVVPLYIGLYLALHNRHNPILWGRLYDNVGVEAFGDVLTFGGLLFSVWARVHLGRYWSGIITLKEGHKLIRTGPYAMTRHPIYTGLLIAAIGSALTSSTGDAIIGFFFILGSLVWKSRREEILMLSAFGDEYRTFQKEVPALVPFKAIQQFKAEIRREVDETCIHSDAFRLAALRSEQVRITGILLVFAFLVAVTIIRSIVSPQSHDYGRMGIFLAFYFVAGTYEGFILLIARRATRSGRAVRSWVWALNTIVECSIPTIALLGLTFDKQYMGPYRALACSTVLLYCCFIILSTLRLNAGISLLSGAVSALGYIAVYRITRHVFPDRDPTRVLPTVTSFALYPVMLVLCGGIAAAVARQIRRHVVAALSEAETRLKLDRMERDLQIARAIQMGLLPKNPPACEGYNIAGWSRPADQTGGDYYDWIELPEGKILFTIADATGHGIGPALLIAACRAYFRALATHHDPLETITAQVDALIGADVSDGRFITAAVALLEPKENRLNLYSAGHAPTYFYAAASDAIEAFDADQPPLGVDSSPRDSRARTIELKPGDALVLVTDGFFETRNPAGELLGMERLGDLIRRRHTLPAENLIQALYQDVLEFCGGQVQADDLTAVVIQRTTPGAA